MTPAATWSTPSNLEDANNAKAESLTDALGELVGRRLDRPTAYSIGKLFQKRLVGRPAWIGDGQMVATLRKFPGHSENTYRVDVSSPPEEVATPTVNAFSTANLRQKHSPHSPHSPRQQPGNGDFGKEGNVGNVDTAVPEDGVCSSDAKGATPGWSKRL